MFKKILKRLSLKRLIQKIIRLLYSDMNPISSELERRNFVTKISHNCSSVDLLKIYLSIQCITRDISFSKPYPAIPESEIEEILKELDKIESLSKIENEYLIVSLNLHSLKANWNLSLTTHYFEKGREAYNKNRYSFEGMRYIKEKTVRRPLNLKEYEYCKKSANELEDLDIKVKEAEYNYQEHISDLAAQIALDKMKEEVEQDAKTPGIKSKEQLIKERKQIIEELKRKLDSSHDQPD